MVPTFVQQVIGVFVRAIIVWCAGYIAAHGGPSFTNDQITKAITEIVPVLGVIAWSLWEKYKGRLKYNTALASGKPMSDAQVDAKMADPAHQAPSVLTPKDEVPKVTNVPNGSPKE